MSETKCCSCCGRELPFTEFYKNESYRDGYSNKCKECAKEYARKNKLCNPRKHDITSKQRFRFVESLKKPCAKCGESRLYVIDFHHVNYNNKKMAIGVAKYRLDYTNDFIAEEVEKCICLCANCHREFHHLYGTRPDNPEEALKEYLEGDSNDELSL